MKGEFFIIKIDFSKLSKFLKYECVSGTDTNQDTGSEIIEFNFFTLILLVLPPEV